MAIPQASGAPGVYVFEVPSGSAPIAGAGTGTAAFVGCYTWAAPAQSSSSSSSSSSSASPPPAKNSGRRSPVTAASTKLRTLEPVPVAPKVPVLCTNFTQFLNAFNPDPEHLVPTAGNGLMFLQQAVYGFFQNGGTLAWVIRIEGTATGVPATNEWEDGDFTEALKTLEPIVGISTVAAPGMMTTNACEALRAHCEDFTKDRFAILELPNMALPDAYIPWNENATVGVKYPLSDYVGLYYPWLVLPSMDPAAKSGDTQSMPPAGHLAGIFARVSSTRGPNKAPANEVVKGALNFTYGIGSDAQNWYNVHAINCLRAMANGLNVWGARTLVNPEALRQNPPQVLYINARRFLNFLKDSLYNGLQWSVFEPNNSTLWQNVTRNVNAFLKEIWASGALIGDSPEEAFYVLCNAENNPNPKSGNLYVEIGVRIAEPAEFVIITLNDWAGPPQG